ncbi:polyprenyl synthetase family protein [Streptomyces sp. NPDC048018]|uniref:polyprenyl synthetase family protein n=1 Tax=Streptomyces sp. NPDC048018 TaxID=3365499 RepID=UPI003719A59B
MRTSDPLLVDRNVPAAVGTVLDDVLRRRLSESRAAHRGFASDIGERVATFTVTGGRRRRSQLVWWSMRACGGGPRESEATLRAAAAVELIQTCALIHDDVMDGSVLRRGRPSVHAAVDRQYGTQNHRRPFGTFGGAAAVLAGDLALAWADDTFVDVLARTPHARELSGVWRVMRTEMVAGQYLDLHAQATGSRSPGRAMRAAVLKTAQYSAVHPLALGAILAGADRDVVRALRRAGLCAGMAFQLHDDVQGAFGDPAVTGKPAGEDLREGKATYLVAVARSIAVRKGDREALRLLDEVVGSPLVTEDDVARVLDLLVASGARDRVAARIERLCSRSMAVLGSGPLSSGATGHIGRLLLEPCGFPDPAPITSTATPSTAAPSTAARRADPRAEVPTSAIGGVR